MKNKIEELEGTILPIVTPTPIYYSLFAADKLSMIMLNKNAQNWIYNNFIQLVFYKENLKKFRFDSHCVAIWPVDTMKMDYTGANLFLREYHINDKIYNLTRENLIENIKSWIDRGFYIIGNVDVTKLKGTRYYGKPPFCHSAMIIGYNKTQLYQFDFSEKGNLGIIRIANDDFIDSVFSESLEMIFRNRKHMDVRYNFSLFELKDEFRSECKLDTEVIKFWVKSYIDCADCGITTDFFMRREELASGFDVYDNVNRIIEIMANEHQEIDYRMFHAIYEHKLIMRERVKFLLEKGYLDGDFNLLFMCEENVKFAEIIKNYVLKYNFKQSENCLIQIKNCLNKLCMNEELFMNKFYGKL